jgi:hypothetical protein
MPEKTRYLVNTAESRVRFLKGFPSMKSSTSGSPLRESSEFSMKICGKEVRSAKVQ